ncbi:putative ankyrin repeat protein [Neofusicoccum parvum]|uniref:Ankyrin repeat protein n=1 Tax=Neofusicoccum parvum TaxID=310453 RepID=A0ACB5RRL6_9PEZI|nr:putative ankyrin repeat protein [Neofusicoccum parvum]GME51304.1 putative ankyrin repeat protein [Neofusicoccum parvum]
MAAVTIDRLLNLAADDPAAVLAQLPQHPQLAAARDAHGYSLAHAACSYGHLDLLRALVRHHGVSPDIRDEDAETPLFAAESVDAARCLLDELAADPAARNDDGQTAEEKIEAEGDFPLVAAYLRSRMAGAANGDAAAAATRQNGADGLAHPPPLPDGVKVNVGTMSADDVPEDVVDPEFRRKIEELAAREDYQSEEAQAELRRLVQDAVGGMRSDTQAQDRNVRRREE